MIFKGKPQEKNALALNQNKGKRPMKKHDDYACSYYGLNGHRARACRIPKHFVDLYQTSIKSKGKRFESHFINNAIEEANIEINNALVIHTTSINEVSLAPIEVKSLDISDFLKIMMKRQNPLDGGKIPKLKYGKLRNLCIPYKPINE